MIPGNHEKFPKLADGSRDLDKSWSHVQTYKAMEKLLKTGKVKAIGVANYSVKYLEELLPQVSVIPAVNQIENHPSLPQQEIVDFCRAKGIHVTAYSPFGSTGGPMFSAEPVLEVAKRRNITVGSVLLSYHSRSLLCLDRSLLISLKSLEEARCLPNPLRLRALKRIGTSSSLTPLIWRFSTNIRTNYRLTAS